MRAHVKFAPLDFINKKIKGNAGFLSESNIPFPAVRNIAWVLFSLSCLPCKLSESGDILTGLNTKV